VFSFFRNTRIRIYICIYVCARILQQLSVCSRMGKPSKFYGQHVSQVWNSFNVEHTRGVVGGNGWECRGLEVV